MLTLEGAIAAGSAGAFPVRLVGRGGVVRSRYRRAAHLDSLPTTFSYVVIITLYVDLKMNNYSNTL